MALSDLSSDGDDDPLPDPVPGGPMGGEATGRRARAHLGVKQTARAAGSGKRQRAFTRPLPPNWKRTEAGGYQEYELPADSRVYQWRTFEYTDAYKKGEERTVAPAPPTLFPDKFLIMNHPKKKISEATADSKPRRLLKACWPSPVSAKMSETSPGLHLCRSVPRTAS